MQSCVNKAQIPIKLKQGSYFSWWAKFETN